RDVFALDESSVTKDGAQTGYSNHGAEERLRELLASANPGLLQRTEFDTESECFFAYPANQADAEELWRFIVGYAEHQADGGERALLPPDLRFLLPTRIEAN